MDAAVHVKWNGWSDEGLAMNDRISSRYLWSYLPLTDFKRGKKKGYLEKKYLGKKHWIYRRALVHDSQTWIYTHRPQKEYHSYTHLLINTLTFIATHGSKLSATFPHPLYFLSITHNNVI